MKDKQDDDSKNSGFNETNSDEAKKTNQEDGEKIRENLEFYRKSQENNLLYWQPGKKLKDGKYTIEKMLGKGGFGITYIVKTPGNKQFVVKTLNHQIGNLKYNQDKDNFYNEILKLYSLFYSLHNRHIVQICEMIHEGDLPCIVMEYVKGKTLEEFVNDRGKLPENEAINYILQIGEALQIVHKRNILHRDVKPRNIIIRDNSLEAVLIDLGISRKFAINDELLALTASWTEGYAAIEQYEPNGIQKEFTDVYGLAATLYFMLTKAVPNHAVNRVSSLAEKQEDGLLPPKIINPKISDEVNRAILKGMKVFAKDRPQSVQEWLDLLAKPESKKTVKSSPPQHNPPRRSRPAPVPPPIPNLPVIQPEKLPSSPVTDWGLYGRTAFMGAGVWLIAIAIFNSQSIANQGIWIAVGIILWGISLFLKNHSSLGQKILQHIFSLLSSCLIYLFLNFLKPEASSIIFLAPISGILAMIMMAMAELFITSDTEES